MEIFIWILIGVILGWSAGKIVKAPNEDMLTDLSLGVLGALIGGIILNIFGTPQASKLNIYSIMIAGLGAVILIWLGRILKQA